MTTVTLIVPEIEGDAGTAAIKKALNDTGAMFRVDVLVDYKTVSIDFDENKIDEQKIREILSEAGFIPS